MIILKEKQTESGNYEFYCEFEENEIHLLLNYAVNNILKEQIERMKNKEKVFCIDCKYYRFFSNLHSCNAPNNKKDTFLKPKSKKILRPAVKNKNNDCDWHESNESNINT